MGETCLIGVYTKAYNTTENTEMAPVSMFKLNNIIVPNKPINRLKISACPVLILPEGNGRSAVRVINLSRSRSMISLKPFAEPVTKNPLTVRTNQFTQLISPCTLLPIKKAIDAEKTTVSDNRSFTSFLKSSIKLFTFSSKALYIGWFYLIIIIGNIERQIPA